MKRQLGRACALFAVCVALAFAGTAHAQVEEDLKDGDRYYDQGEFKKAAKKYDNAIRKFPGQVSAAAYGKRASIFVILAGQARKQSKRQAILEDGLKFVTQKAEAQHPGAAEVLAQKALIYWELGSKPDAIKVAEEVAKKDSTTFTVQAMIGEFYAVREPKKAIKAYEAYLKHRPKSLERGDVLPRVRLGFAYLKSGYNTGDPKIFAKASKQFEVLLQRHKKRRNAAVNANNGLCAAYTALKKFDRAITICETIIQNPRHIDRAGSVWYNLGRSYLEKKQPRRARTAGSEYVRMRKSEPKGHLLIGDSYLAERNWERALDAYLKAEELARGNRRFAAQLGVKLGISYRRLNRPKDAITKLEAAIAIDGDNMQLVTELGNAYIADKQDIKALATVEKLIKSKQFGGMTPGERAALHVIAGRAAYNTKKNGEARKSFEQAYALRPKDVKVRLGLVQTINLQAYKSFKADKPAIAEQHLTAAHKINPRAALTNQNLAVMWLARGKCGKAREFLGALKSSKSHGLMYHRLMGRVSLCSTKPNRKAAIEHYARAEKLAKAPGVQANLLLAEIYTEWAPLIWKSKLSDAIDKLETAVQFTVQAPAISDAANRNLALALFRRGWVRMKNRKPAAAVEDFAKAARNPGLLKGTELSAFEFSEALARLEKGETSGAAKIFGRLAKRGGQNKYLKAPYSTVGAQFFGAYANYRGNSKTRKKAASAFASMQGKAKGKFGAKVRELIASNYMYMAADAHRGGKSKTVNKHLTAAAKYAGTAAQKRSIAHNKAVMKMGKKKSAAVLKSFAGMGASPPEALANSGIMLDRAGKPKAAYDAWNKAKAKGVKSQKLNKWINAKKRIFGY